MELGVGAGMVFAVGAGVEGGGVGTGVKDMLGFVDDLVTGVSSGIGVRLGVIISDGAGTGGLVHAPSNTVHITRIDNSFFVLI